MKIGRQLKDLLNKHDLKVAQLARATGIPRQTLDNWILGQDPRNLKQVKIIADHFKVSIEFLCFGEQPKERSLVEFEHEINAGVFEVVLRRVNKNI